MKCKCSDNNIQSKPANFKLNTRSGHDLTLGTGVFDIPVSFVT